MKYYQNSLTYLPLTPLIKKGLILSGHDRSDGGLIVCLLEMAFAGNCGLGINLRAPSDANWDAYFFNQEAGAVIEFLPERYGTIKKVLRKYDLQGCGHTIGVTIEKKDILVFNRGYELLSDSMPRLRDIWQETSFQLDALQANPEVVKKEQENIFDRPRDRAAF